MSTTNNSSSTIPQNPTVKGRVVFADNPFALRDWDAAKNTAAGNGDPHKMPASVVRKIHFHCTDCGHDYQRWAAEAFKASDTKPCCIYCAKFPTAPLCANADPGSQNHCVSCFGRSYAGVAAAHAANVCWTWSAEKNDMAPHKAHAYGRDEAVFDCNQCHHEFRFTLSKISLKAAMPNTKVCPFCAGRDVCDDVECTVCAAERRLRQGAPEKTAPPDRAKVEENRRNGLNWCVCCKVTKPLLAFARNNHKNPNGPVRNTCMQCHNTNHYRRVKIRVVDTLAVKPIPTRTCKECGVAKLATAFHIVDRTEECLECYNRRVTSTLVGGQVHQGPRPKACRSCRLVFTEDNLAKFYYCAYQRKYVDECTACRTDRTAFKRKNIVDEKMDDIRLRAEQQNMLFSEADAGAMSRKLTMPCVYCGHAPLNCHLGGLDRVDSSHGYTDASTVPSCADCNYMKKALSLDEFKLRMLHHGPVLEKGNGSDTATEEEKESGCKRPCGGDGSAESTSSSQEAIAPPKKARKARKERAGKNTSIVFYNVNTGAIAQRVTTLGEAAAIADICHNHVCTKLSNNDTSVWIKPDWSARREDAPATGVIEDPAERDRLAAAIALRRKIPTRTVKSYRMIHKVTGITTMEGMRLSLICRAAKVLKADVLELFRQAEPTPEGVSRIGPFHHYFLEELQREENMV